MLFLQLFGDTVNTASRMESTGVPGRIQLSEAAAAEVIAVGRGEWLTERPDKIVAKGKGEMKTYFASIPSSKNDTYTASTTNEESYSSQSKEQEQELEV